MRYFPPRADKTGSGWSGRNNAAHLRFMRAVKKRDGHQCQDCGATTDLRACHIVPLREGGSYDPSNGITRCKRCDKRTDPFAR
jgi:5-methylcytosine-specific restriction endonuclease McrA